MTTSGTFSFNPSAGQCVYGKITKYRDGGRDHPFVVYMALNKVNGAFYIGATEKGTEQRSIIHLGNVRRAEKNLRFYRAVRKHGAENFKFLTIKECSDYWDALESERQYISLLKPRYNMTAGGGGIKGYRHTPEAIVKMSAAKKGKPGHPNSPEHKLRLAECRRAEKGIKKLHGSAKEAIRANSRKANAARRRRVLNETTGEIYPSVKDASKALGLSGVMLAKLFHGFKTTKKTKTHGLQVRLIGKDE